ncbi:SRPBCC family protein [Nocardioides luteus]|uniref:MxaD family protein n=1 Tax=Nocardioides luteus TaxID=1844 RepID=A0A1J4MWN2_9ACTN|nr:SRPBCC family protein [Nocardioides luteus]OIJ23780.1 MxaD family protein [Nocardioides luteus]
MTQHPEALHLESSRAVPVEPEKALDLVLPAPLPRIFGRRYAAITPIAEVRDQAGDWSSAGETRTIVLADGATMRETLTAIDAPTSFSYEITPLSGPLKLLVGHVAGRWSFAPAGTGTRITWSWDVTPTSSAASFAMPVFGWMWKGYARQSLESLEELLVGA